MILPSVPCPDLTWAITSLAPARRACASSTAFLMSAAVPCKIAHRGEGADVQIVILDQPPHRSLSIADALGNDFDVAEGGGDIGLVVLDKFGERPEQLVNLLAAEAFGQVFH